MNAFEELDKLRAECMDLRCELATTAGNLLGIGILLEEGKDVKKHVQDTRDRIDRYLERTR